MHSLLITVYVVFISQADPCLINYWIFSEMQSFLSSYSWKEGLFAHCWEKIEFWQSLIWSFFKYLGPRKMENCISWGWFWLVWAPAVCAGMRPASSWDGGTGGFSRFVKEPKVSRSTQTLSSPLSSACLHLPCSSLCVRKPDPSQPYGGRHHLHPPLIYLNLSLWLWHSVNLYQRYFS